MNIITPNLLIMARTNRRELCTVGCLKGFRSYCIVSVVFSTQRGLSIVVGISGNGVFILPTLFVN